jgi:hypothetical protein
MWHRVVILRLPHQFTNDRVNTEETGVSCMTSLVLSTVTFAQSIHQIGGWSIGSAGEELPGATYFYPTARQRSRPTNHRCRGELCSASRLGLLRLLRRGKYYRYQQRGEVEQRLYRSPFSPGYDTKVLVECGGCILAKLWRRRLPHAFMRRRFRQKPFLPSEDSACGFRWSVWFDKQYLQVSDEVRRQGHLLRPYSHRMADNRENETS